MDPAGWTLTKEHKNVTFGTWPPPSLRCLTPDPEAEEAVALFANSSEVPILNSEQDTEERNFVETASVKRGRHARTLVSFWQVDTFS